MQKWLFKSDISWEEAPHLLRDQKAIPDEGVAASRSTGVEVLPVCLSHP